MEFSNDSNFIMFKFGGYWTEVKGQNRKKYEGGNQKTVKVVREAINMSMLKDEVEVICPWIRGYNFEFYYHVTGTSPKKYVLIANDVDIVRMIENFDRKNVVEVVIVVDEREQMCHEITETPNQYQGMELYFSNHDYDVDCDIPVDNIDDGFFLCDNEEAKGLRVGARFQDAQAFKQALRTDAISHNVGIRIKASDRTRVIAICTHRGCPWRVRASLCSDGSTFEVRKLAASHVCPGVNRAGNNMSESFNAWIGEARGKPVVELVDMIRGMLMEQRAQRKVNASSWKGTLVPHVEEYIKDITSKKEQFIIRQSTSSKAEIEGKSKRHEVDIDERECTCRFWQLTGLPCIHAVAFIGTKQQPLWHTYVDERYYVFRYQMAYDGAISTLPGKEQWVISDDGVHIGVPKTLRPRGRPKKKRIKSFLESRSKKNRSIHKCSRCGLWGHHKNTCKNPIGEPSMATTQTDEGIPSDIHTIPVIKRRLKLQVRRETMIGEMQTDE